jgi:hypothetical protein
MKPLNPSLNCPFCGDPSCSANCDEIRAKVDARLEDLVKFGYYDTTYLEILLKG